MLIEIISVVGVFLLVTLAFLKYYKTGKFSEEDKAMFNRLMTSLKHSYENNNFAVFLDEMAIKIRAGEFDDNAKDAIKFLQSLLPDQNDMRKADLEFLIKMIRNRK